MRKIKAFLAVLSAAAMLTVTMVGCGGGLDVPTNTPAQQGQQGQQGGQQQGGEQQGQQGGEQQQAAELTYADGTVLRMATGYNSKKTGLTFDPDTAGEGITLADGKTYHTGDFKPTWVEVMNILNIKIEDKYQGNSANNEFDYWKEQMGSIDVLSGTASKLTEYGEAGSLVNIGEYLDSMPNFKAYLEANPIVRLSITGNTSNGAIYFSPYFDGVNDIERMP
ncbi:MAG: hypothetical protein IKQ24_10260, partial [Verrucomicrobia bacterium]|nr:hypothetical protein [Verrucomicrobiota bacterium]